MTSISNIPIEFSISPNPVRDIAQIQVEQNVESSLRIEIYDVIGQKILSRRIVNNKQNINLQSFENGVYLYKIVTEDNKQLKQGKLIVQH
ncbi:MAG: T9SS type A sorting domain-containing protein [Flavobacteriales bacterium]|nr:T9SS type A sorting domain-containing protein [Flavobacteriales bacterium]